MISPAWLSIVAGFVAAMAGVLAAILLLMKRPSTTYRSLAGLLAAAGVANLADGLTLLDQVHALMWRDIAMVAELVQPAALFYAGLTFLKSSVCCLLASLSWARCLNGSTLTMPNL
jgi:hypothetical protein